MNACGIDMGDFEGIRCRSTLVSVSSSFISIFLMFTHRSYSLFSSLLVLDFFSPFLM